jgi:hypothetical protein
MNAPRSPDPRETTGNQRRHAARRLWRDGWTWNLAAAILAGCVLRVYRLETQFPMGDEWHALIAAAKHGYLALLTSFFGGGHAIPDALYFRALTGLGGITETGIYAPVVVTGIAATGVVPWLLRDTLGGRISAILAWLIALSPVLILYSRFARPYGIVALLTLVAVWGLSRWIDTRARRHLVAYGLAGSLAAYFHAIALPFVLAPIAVAVLHDLLSRRQGMAVSAGNALVAGLAIGFPALMLLGAPVWNSFGVFTDKVAQGVVTPGSMLGVYQVLAGSQELPITLAIAGLALLGTWALVRADRSRRFALLLLAGSAAQLAMVMVSKPLAVEGPHIFARYLIPVMFPLLVLVAAGFGEATRRLPSVAVAGIAAALLGFYFANTIAWILTRYNSQTSLYLHAYLIAGKSFEQFPLTSARRKIPAFYDMLSHKPPGEVVIVEAPFQVLDFSLVAYQLVHRQRVLMGMAEPLCGRGVDLQNQAFDAWSRARLRNIVDISDPAALAARGASFVVFHRHIRAETSAIEVGFVDMDMAPCIAHYRDAYGPAVFDDGEVVAFSVKPPGR